MRRGGGATLNFGVTDAIFRPLADRQELAARESDLQTARNDALLAVALAYFDVQQARGTLAGTLDAVVKAEGLVQKTTGLARGLVPEIEVDRARALLLDLQQQVAASRANWRITSARLTRVLRLNPGAVVVPMEPPHLQVSLISTGFRVADLVPVGLTNRPELASQRASVQASLERVRQERVRPFVPSLVMEGRNGPGGAFNGGVFGGGPDNGSQLYGGRFDLDMGVVWTLNNLGAGNRSLVRERIAQEQKASIDFANVQDQVAQEVVQAHAQLEAAATQVDDAMTAGERGDHYLQRHVTGYWRNPRCRRPAATGQSPARGRCGAPATESGLRNLFRGHQRLQSRPISTLSGIGLSCPNPCVRPSRWRGTNAGHISAAEYGPRLPARPFLPPARRLMWGLPPSCRK